jgi:HipA-like protein
MRKAQVYRNGILAGTLIEKNRNSYIFRYDQAYFIDKEQPAISLTISKRKQQYHSRYLFPFFFNMLSEGMNRKLQSIQLKIDKKDSFGLLLATARFDTIGAITIKPVIEQ